MNDTSNIDPLRFRQVLGHFASGVTVVTTETPDGEVHGMTANAFLSVSLEPPLVLVAIDNRAQMHALLPQTHRFGISILAEDQQAVSRHFAGRPQEGLPIVFLRHQGVPLIAGAVAHVVCRLHETHPAGDHTLYIGRVEHLSHQVGMRPLMFYGGEYRALNVQLRDPEFWWW